MRQPASGFVEPRYDYTLGSEACLDLEEERLPKAGVTLLRGLTAQVVKGLVQRCETAAANGDVVQPCENGLGIRIRRVQPTDEKICLWAWVARVEV